MNISAKCNCCMCEPVCKYKTTYEAAREAILSTPIKDQTGENGGFWTLKSCPIVEVSIRCPHMITRSKMEEE